jgi:hypothetical protein
VKRMMVAGATVLTLAFAGQALAQAVSVELEPAQRTRIKEYVVKEKVAPVRVKERVSVGATLPADVELRAVPSDWVRPSRSIGTSTRTIMFTSSIRRVAGS